jgi:hypothetical protein
MSKENVKEKEKLVAGPGWRPDTKTRLPDFLRPWTSTSTSGFDPLTPFGGGLEYLHRSPCES